MKTAIFVIFLIGSALTQDSGVRETGAPEVADSDTPVEAQVPNNTETESAGAGVVNTPETEPPTVNNPPGLDNVNSNPVEDPGVPSEMETESSVPKSFPGLGSGDNKPFPETLSVADTDSPEPKSYPGLGSVDTKPKTPKVHIDHSLEDHDDSSSYDHDHDYDGYERFYDTLFKGYYHHHY